MRKKLPAKSFFVCLNEYVRLKICRNIGEKIRFIYCDKGIECDENSEMFNRVEDNRLYSI